MTPTAFVSNRTPRRKIRPLNSVHFLSLPRSQQLEKSHQCSAKAPAQRGTPTDQTKGSSLLLIQRVQTTGRGGSQAGRHCSVASNRRKLEPKMAPGSIEVLQQTLRYMTHTACLPQQRSTCEAVSMHMHLYLQVQTDAEISQTARRTINHIMDHRLEPKTSKGPSRAPENPRNKFSKHEHKEIST